MDSHLASTITLPIRAIVFDIGGVFFPWPQPDFFAHWEEKMRIMPGTLNHVLWHGPDIEAANIGTITAEEYCRRAARRLRADQAHVRLLVEHAFSGEQLNDDLVTYARTLRSRVQVAALTNTWSFGRALLQRRAITDLFDLIVSSAEEGIKKPDARIYQIILERLAVLPAEAIFIDDSEENIEGARALGIHSIQFFSTNQIMTELERLLGAYDIRRKDP
jgi:putative hydrolase of the HAD superfamily